MLKLSRRHFIQSAAAVTVGFAGFHRFLNGENAAYAAAAPEDIPFGFGPLAKDPNGIMDLPKGFAYTVVSRLGDPMADGLPTPGRPDGMAAFPGAGGKTIIVRNHELSPDDVKNGPWGEKYEKLASVPKEKLFDYGRGQLPCLGGTSNIIFDTKTQKVERAFMSLAGTIRNCAGGPTPWGSWVTCEETVARADDKLEHDHGWNFEVPADSKGLVDPRPIKAMGRFNHEAIAVDPSSGIVYQTEDDHEGLLFRFIPNRPGDLHAGGKLQALKVIDKPSLDTRNWDGNSVPVGQQMAVEWIDMDNVESPENDLRFRGFAAGAARFARGEGMWYGNDAVYFACTNGGAKKRGQIWKYTPSKDEGMYGEKSSPGKLELFIEPNDGDLVDNADNLTVSPFGDLIICEDGGGDQFLVGVTQKGEIYKFARNAVSDSELAGATFSPDGSTLFVNVQHNHITLAVTGPWRRG